MIEFAKTFTKFPSIEQYRQVVKQMTDHIRYIGKDESGNAMFDATKELPVVVFQATVKVHGTNGGVSFTKDIDGLQVQSRNRFISAENDNAGFAKFVEERKGYFENRLQEIMAITADIERIDVVKVTVFGKFAGETIQKNVAVAKLPKMFLPYSVFATSHDGCVYDISKIVLPQAFTDGGELNIFPIGKFPTVDIAVDLERPDLAVQQLQQLALQYEECCPVAEHFGVQGIGEGIVCTTRYGGTTYRFKVKGELPKKTLSKNL